MPKLKSRDKQIPYGFFFYQPQTNWNSRSVVGQFPSFNALVSAVINMRLANKDITQKYNLATDWETVANEVDEFNANICFHMGWADYITSQENIPVQPFPKEQAPPSNPQPNQYANLHDAAVGRINKIWAGANLVTNWLFSKAETVDRATANSRAAMCATCTFNGEGDFTEWFTRPLSAAIKRQIELIKSKGLTTDYDDKLNVCQICLCPLKLKVHAPDAIIMRYPYGPKDFEKVEKCWVKELLLKREAVLISTPNKQISQ